MCVASLSEPENLLVISNKNDGGWIKGNDPSMSHSDAMHPPTPI
jgi:hypothetical protein